MKRNSLILFILSLVCLSSCADAVVISTTGPTIMPDSVGFWYGCWHASIMPISFICSLFDDTVSVYAVYNNGGWYDLGFVLGLGATIKTIFFLIRLVVEILLAFFK